VRLFEALGTQWRMSMGPGGAVWLGLDYAAIEPVARFNRIDIDEDAFDALRILESAALTLLNKR